MEKIAINKEKIDLRTPLQREKAERNKNIFQEYQFILRNSPEKTSKWSIWRYIGEKYGLKAQGVRVIISKMEANK